MDDGSARQGVGYRGKARGAGDGSARRPDRVALWAFLLAVGAMIVAAASAQAGSGGLSVGGGGGVGAGGGTGTVAHHARYTRIWESFSAAEHHWAHHTSYCESGENPKAIGGGGAYRGAFMFTRPAWKGAPKSPGGDPINYTWRTQAVVAVALKHQLGTRPWPVCG